jgi:hypothetical protein
MKPLLKYWPVLLILLAFFSGRFTASDNSEELLENGKQERQLLMEKVVEKQVEITKLRKDSAAVRGKMHLDSLRFAKALQENQRAYNALKRKYNEINLNRATVHGLDSIVSLLLPD